MTVRAMALRAADPRLDEAVQAGALDDAQRRALRRRIYARGVV